MQVCVYQVSIYQVQVQVLTLKLAMYNKNSEFY